MNTLVCLRGFIYPAETTYTYIHLFIYRLILLINCAGVILIRIFICSECILINFELQRARFSIHRYTLTYALLSDSSPVARWLARVFRAWYLLILMYNDAAACLRSILNIGTTYIQIVYIQMPVYQAKRFTHITQLQRTYYIHSSIHSSSAHIIYTALALILYGYTVCTIASPPSKLYIQILLFAKN